ncbi:hypothetical protein J7E93_06825 [Streptomyces sp. ISL-36]|nr:hypothetical protein [Streptomyces sp. ISL-36]
MVDAAEADGELIGRCYTKARRAPLVHGVIRDVNGGRGIRLPGGPYTLTQLAAIVGTFVVLILTRRVWGGHGVFDAVLLLGLPFAAAFALRHLHIDGRNPAAALVSVVTMLTGPKWGRLHGRPFRPARPTRADARVTLAASGEPPAPAAPTVRRMPAATAPATRSATDAATGTPVASGVQALLARRTTTAEKED